MSKMERESERDVGGGPSQTERAEKARAMEEETESQAEINSKDESREVRRFSQLYNTTLLNSSNSFHMKLNRAGSDPHIIL